MTLCWIQDPGDGELCPQSSDLPICAQDTFAVQLGNPDTRPDMPNLGALPRGFQQSDGGFGCDSTDAGFVRGILLPTDQYNAMSIEQRLALRDPNVFPRWRLYGGPFSQRAEADAWDRYLYFYGFNNNLTWVSHGTICIVPSYVIPWPADASRRWDWIYEAQKPPEAKKVYDANKGQNTVVWV